MEPSLGLDYGRDGSNVRKCREKAVQTEEEEKLWLVEGGAVLELGLGRSFS